MIVVNGAAPDQSLAAVLEECRQATLLSCPAGRGRQMNAGALSARGRWFLFLHADTHLSAGWLDEIRRADSDPTIVGGSFQFRLDASAWQARVIEWFVRWRVRWLDLAYGDQALFVRQDAFHAIGGYREWPLMEDVDLIRRLRQAGRLYHSARAAITSARRWERDGWWRRSGQNVLLQALYFAGVRPGWLAKRYEGRASRPLTRHALVMMARAPSDARGKSRLTRDVPGDHLELRRAILLDTFDAVARIREADLFVAFEPAEALAEFQSLVGGAAGLLPQRGDTLGERMHNVFADLFGRGYSNVVMVGSDVPTLPPVYVEQAFDGLREHRRQVVIGPATDGGYYLIGLSRPCPELFLSIPWSTPEVLSATLSAAEKLRLSAALTPEWYDVDDVADLRRVAGETTCAARTRSWLTTHVTVGDRASAPVTGTLERS
jgi:rSAM/selenodomain-associated transferase 2/rSAM/selenodomain-associated transferase 1